MIYYFEKISDKISHFKQISENKLGHNHINKVTARRHSTECIDNFGNIWEKKNSVGLLLSSVTCFMQLTQKVDNAQQISLPFLIIDSFRSNWNVYIIQSF